MNYRLTVDMYIVNNGCSFLLQAKGKGRKRPIIYMALVWGVLILIISRMTVFARRRSISEFDVVDTSALLGIILIMALGALLLINKRVYYILRCVQGSSVKWLVGYFLLCLVSFIWSWNSAFTAYRAIEVLLILIAAITIISYSKDFLSAERALLRFTMITILLSFAMRLKYGISLSALHTNLYTIMAGMGWIYTFSEWNVAAGMRKKYLFRYSWVYLFFLVIGTSAGSNIAVACAFIIVLFLLRINKTIIIPVFLITVLVVYLSGMLEEFVWQVLLAGKDVETAARLTGRDYLWAGYWSLFKENPINGYGYAVVARYGDIIGIRGTTNTHNGVFEVLLGTGIIGLILFIYWVVKMSKELFRAYRARVAGSLGSIGVFVVVMINNMSKSIVGGAFDVSFMAVSVFLGFFIIYVYGGVISRKHNHLKHG